MSGNGEFVVEGHQRPFVRDDVRHLNLALTDVYVARALSFIGGAPHPSRSLCGLGHIQRGDTLHYLGDNRRHITDKLPITLSELPEGLDPKHDWKAAVSLVLAHWELHDDDEWYAQAYLPHAHFVELMEEYRRGQLGALWISLAAPFWYQSGDERAPPVVGVPRYLRDEPDREGSPEAAIGSVASLQWTEIVPNPINISQPSEGADTGERERPHGLFGRRR